MWPFSRHRRHSVVRVAASVGTPGLRLPVQVIGALTPGYLRVVVAGNGLIDGGASDWPIEWVPDVARRPNGAFAISGFKDGVPQFVAPRGI